MSQERDRKFYIRQEDIAYEREKRGLKQKELAELTGISFQYMSNIENGHQPLLPHIAERIMFELAKIDAKYAVKSANQDGDTLVITQKAVDMVNHPPHYTQGGIELIDVMKAKMSHEQFDGYLRGQVWKYTFRAGHKKDELEDLRKAQWYLNKLIEAKQQEE